MAWYTTSGQRINYVYADGGLGRFVVLNRFNEPTGKTAEGVPITSEERENAINDSSPIDPNTRSIAVWREEDEDSANDGF